MEQLLQKMFEYFLKECEDLEPKLALEETVEYFNDEVEEFTDSIRQDGYSEGYSEALIRVQDALDRI